MMKFFPFYDEVGIFNRWEMSQVCASQNHLKFSLCTPPKDFALISFPSIPQYYGECALVSYFSGMPGNTIGKSLVLTTYGGKPRRANRRDFGWNAVGNRNQSRLVGQKALDRRRPGQSHLTTERNEEDTVIFQWPFLKGKQRVRLLLFLF